MLEKRFLELFHQYKHQIENLEMTPTIIEKLKYIQNCLDHLENEIEDLTINCGDKTKKEENKFYEKIQKDLGPFILAYIVQNSN